MASMDVISAFCAYQSQLKTLCLHEFPCGLGNWRDFDYSRLKKVGKKKLKESVENTFEVTLKECNPQFAKTETLQELVTSDFSPWHLDYSWSNEAEKLREIAVKSPWLIDEKFVLSYFRTLRIVDKGVMEVDKDMLRFTHLEELTMSANYIKTISSKNLPATLTVLELCANEIADVSGLCLHPPPLLHLGLGYNRISFIGDYITGDYWPCLLSLDLSHNNLGDLLDVVRKLGTLPKLRNLVLQGNPLSLVPGYRGYIVDSLRKLTILDDIRISADEKHHFKGLARRREYILDEAKVTLGVTYIKGIPQPDELKNPEEYPEFPIIERTYYVQFMFPEDSGTKADIFQVTHDEFETMSVTQASEQREMGVVQSEANEEGSQEMAGSTVEKNVYFSSKPDLKSVENMAGPGDIPALPMTGEAQSPHEGETTTERNRPTFKLGQIKSEPMPWAEELELNWTTTLVRDNLLGLRDFFTEGMEFSVMESVVQCFPAEEEQTAPASAGKKGKTPDKKGGTADKGKDKKDDKKKKGKKEPEMELKRMPPELHSLATFQVPLSDFLEGEFDFQSIYSKGNVEVASTIKSSDMQDSSRKKKGKKGGKDKKGDKGKDKDKDKKPSSAKKGKDAKDTRKGSAKGDKKGDKGKKGGGKTDEEDEEPSPPPPLELQMSVHLHHWETAMDSLKEEEERKRMQEEA